MVLVVLCCGVVGFGFLECAFLVSGFLGFKSSSFRSGSGCGLVGFGFVLFGGLVY